MENVIGLSRTDCPCVDDRPVDAGVSQSGLYLDELPGLHLRALNAAKKCGQGTIWTMMEQARENAIEETIEAVMAGVNMNTDPRRMDGTSEIGDAKKATAVAHKLGYAYHGLTLQTAKVKGGTFEVVAIATAFKSGVPGSVMVNVYQRESLSGTPLASYELPCTGDRVVWTELPEPLVLSTDVLGMDNPRYWFLYEPTGDMRAMNTLFDCGCSGSRFKPYWSQETPQYASANQKAGMIWADWCMASGTFGNTLNERDDWSTGNNPTDGIMLRVRFKCDSMSTFCPDEPDYKTDEVQRVLAHAVRFKAGANLVRDLQSMVDPNIYTMSAGEQLTDNRRKYESEWKNRVEGFIVPTLSNIENVNRYGDCRKCKDQWGMRRSTMRN